MSRCHGDGLCERYYDLSMDLAQTTNVETSLATDRLVKDFRVHIRRNDHVRELQTFALVYFDC